MRARTAVIRVEEVQERILLIRGEKVIVDADLARFYGVATKRLNEQVKRNRKRFPRDFMFQLTSDERSEVVAKCDHLSALRFSKALPLAFTEHGALMAATVLNTPRAVEVSVFIVRAFVSLRHAIAGNRALSHRLDELERRLGDHDRQIIALMMSPNDSIQPPDRPLPRARLERHAGRSAADAPR